MEEATRVQDVAEGRNPVRRVYNCCSTWQGLFSATQSQNQHCRELRTMDWRGWNNRVAEEEKLIWGKMALHKVNVIREQDVYLPSVASAPFSSLADVHLCIQLYSFIEYLGAGPTIFCFNLIFCVSDEFADRSFETCRGVENFSYFVQRDVLGILSFRREAMVGAFKRKIGEISDEAEELEAEMEE
ncbi:hypothetical protein FNV43_RR25069 [Rhamnella rubrinervis]|uniref:Uncharacterized protein n=1 Tax=Rhamnella rubrinervis TaxID=2594499 RepID=A0A8K0DSG9_9ROSA|nr:hypothetical protein FNV43_RR25069 [Rhamnella rubrinervis]